MKGKKYEVYYDEEADFLELYLGEPSECHTSEIEPGIFVRRDNSSNDIKSVEIIGFKKRGSESLKNIFFKNELKTSLRYFLINHDISYAHFP